MSLSTSQSTAIETAERVCSILSLVGATFIITTFLSNSAFHKPINRLVFYAAWGNVLANIATLIGPSGIRLGSHGALCQFQALFIQWCVPDHWQDLLATRSDMRTGSCLPTLCGRLQWLATYT
jgi:hypothetical protein